MMCHIVLGYQLGLNYNIYGPVLHLLSQLR